MLKYIALIAPANRLRYRTLFEQITIPRLMLTLPREINACYQRWDLNK
jgi:hypothetical protein